MRTLGRGAVVAGLLLALTACEREEKMVREDLPMARATKARTDAQMLAAAVNAFRTSCGKLPEALTTLTTPQMVDGAPCGPMIGSVPNPPPGWRAYALVINGDSFTVTTTDGKQTVSAP